MALDNLVDLIVTCLTHPAAANQTFLVSDGEDVSTTEAFRRMGQALGCPAQLIPVRHKDEKAMKKMFDPALAVVSKCTGSDAKSLPDQGWEQT